MTDACAHTPGPWKTYMDEYRGQTQSCVIPAAESDHPQGPLHIANINESLGEESAANASLIAAAPELLEALEGMLEWAELSVKPHDPEGLPISFSEWQVVARKARNLVREDAE